MLVICTYIRSLYRVEKQTQQSKIRKCYYMYIHRKTLKHTQPTTVIAAACILLLSRRDIHQRASLNYCLKEYLKTTRGQLRGCLEKQPSDT